MDDGTVDCTDIDQGSLGCCYALAAYSSECHPAYRLEESILTDDLNSAGVFAAIIVDIGKVAKCIVDDWIPYYKTWGPYFSKIDDRGGIWGMMLEKCWIK